MHSMRTRPSGFFYKVCTLAITALLIGLALFSTPGFAQSLTDLDALYFVADIDHTLPGTGPDISSDDGAVIHFDVNSTSASSSNDLGALDQAGIDGIHITGDDACGASIYSVDTTTMIMGVAMRPADVFTAAGVKVLDADSVGIPAGINVDAVTRESASCDLLISIDSTTMLGGTAFTPSDIIRWDGGSSFSLYLATGFKMNVDALHYLTADRMLVSVDITGTLPDVDVRDEEVMEISTSGGAFQLIAFEPALLNNTWQGADLNALWALPAPLNGALQWQSTHMTTLESSGTVTLTINRVDGSEGAVTVNWSTADGSATSGNDYTGGSGNIPFANGQTTATLNLTLLDDALIEGEERFTVTLNSTTGGASIGSPSQITVIIRDDEDYIFSDGFE
ncbi:MAG: Calx-beta domain-containing protein [bacterium]